MKENKRGFTLLELLVVVLIIGILAAIALPRYQLAVGKVKFSELKTITKSIAGAAQRYYMVNGEYPQKAKDLDIDFDITSDGNWFTISKKIQCHIWGVSEAERLACQKIIFGETVRLYLHRDTARPYACWVYNTDKNSLGHSLCQKETGKKFNQNNCVTGCWYYY